jgi:hypothetical protein
VTAALGQVLSLFAIVSRPLRSTLMCASCNPNHLDTCTTSTQEQVRDALTASLHTSRSDDGQTTNSGHSST